MLVLLLHGVAMVSTPAGVVVKWVADGVCKGESMYMQPNVGG
jgi:hypothetical protein